MENYTTVQLPLTKEKIKELKAGTPVLLNGRILVMRDAGHKKYFDLLNANATDIDFKNEIIYYMGPCPAKANQIIGSCGPTTSGRMEKYTPTLHKMGLSATIGKGSRCQDTIDAIKENCAIYFCAIGGAGALYAKCVKSCKILAFEELGTEALRELTVENFPVVVGIDCNGNTIFN